MNNLQLSQNVGIELALPPNSIQSGCHPDYAADMNTVWQLVDIMNEKGCSWSMGGGGDLTTFSIYSDGRYYSHSSSHAPTAILRAVADALGSLISK